MTDKELKIENAHWQTSVMLRTLAAADDAGRGGAAGRTPREA